MTYIINYI